jgi:MFS family permease
MLMAVGVFGLATIVFGLSANLYLSLACLFVLGAADMISVYVRQTLVQLETPDAMRGRVAAVNSVFIGASNELGEFESGVLAALVGPVAAVVLGGLGTIATRSPRPIPSAFSATTVASASSRRAPKLSVGRSGAMMAAEAAACGWRRSRTVSAMANSALGGRRERGR